MRIRKLTAPQPMRATHGPQQVEWRAAGPPPMTEQIHISCSELSVGLCPTISSHMTDAFSSSHLQFLFLLISLYDT